MKYTKEIINEYIKEYKQEVERELGLHADTPVPSFDFIEVIEQLLEEVDNYKNIIISICTHFKFRVEEEDSKYHVSKYGYFDEEFCWRRLSEVWKQWGNSYTYDTEYEAWKEALELSIQDLY